MLQRWLDLAPEVAGVISKAIKTVVFYSVFLLQRWLELAPEVAAPEGSGLNPKGMVFASQVMVQAEEETTQEDLANGLQAMEIG